MQGPADNGGRGSDRAAYKEFIYTTHNKLFEPIGQLPDPDRPWLAVDPDPEYILLNLTLPEDYSADGSSLTISFNTTIYFADFLLAQDPSALERQQQMLQLGHISPFVLEDFAPEADGLSM